MNLDELEKIAKAATPGPWNFYYATGEYPGVFARINGEPVLIPNSFRDAHFIANFNPTQVLSLIADLRKCVEALDHFSLKNECCDLAMSGDYLGDHLIGVCDDTIASLSTKVGAEQRCSECGHLNCDHRPPSDEP